MPKVITLQGNVPADKMEMEIWSGTILFTIYSEHEEAGAGEVILLEKEQVDMLRTQLSLYYNTLVNDPLIEGEWRTNWDAEEARND